MKASTIKWNWVLMLVFLLVPTYGFARQGLTIGEAQTGYVYLSLGMHEDVVMEKLKPFVVGRIPNSNSYGISVKTKDAQGDLYKPLGSISFTNRKLSYISRGWYESFNNRQTFELADKLFHLLKEEIGERVEVKATLKAGSTRDPEKELKWVYITIGNKRIAIMVTESEKAEWGLQVGISEAISSGPFKY